MAYNNNYNSNYRSPAPWQDRQPRDFRSGNYRVSNGQPRSRTRAKAGTYQNRNGHSIPYISGFRPTKLGAFRYFAKPTSKTKTLVAPKNGTKYEIWMVTVKPPMGQAYNASAFYYPDFRKLVVPSERITINPNAPNGGYCGQSGNKNRR
ncbi:MAG: hypothetical protein EOP56_13620 [Sphingobacteriales bacterium]|nr:MAG: hypothetical protein EOP56_13620 [Sphingobacteriales bacterium]